MPLALDSNQIGELSGNGFLHRSKMPPCNMSSFQDHRDLPPLTVVSAVELSRSSSSSIGKNSDDEENENDNDNNEEDEEVESKLKVDALEQALPIRRGISNFYNGKSKSFASLSDVSSSSSIKDVGKPENLYIRKRRNLLAYSLLYDKGRTSLLKSPSIGGGIAKRPIHSSRSTLALAMAMTNCESSINNDNDSSPQIKNSITPPTQPSPESPLPPTPWRSFSLVDLQHCGVSASVKNSNLPSPLMGESTKHDGVS